MDKTVDLWAKIRTVLQTQGLETSPDGMAEAMNQAAGEHRYTGWYIKAVLDGRAPLCPNYFVHARRAFSWTDEEMAAVRARFFEMGREQLRGPDPQVNGFNPIRAEIMARAGSSAVSLAVALLAVGCLPVY